MEQHTNTSQNQNKYKVMKYLIISDAGSMHVYNFINCSLLGRGFEISILSHSTKPIPEQYDKFYKDNSIKVYSIQDLPCKMDRGCVARWKKFAYKLDAIKGLGDIDVCHIHYLHIQSCLLYLLMRRHIKHLILTYWGSDIIKLDGKTKFFQRLCMNYADRITLSVTKTLKIYYQQFGHNYDDKVQILRFLSGALDEIKIKMENSTCEECKQFLQLPLDKKVITIGYNADPAQHQDEFISSLSTLSKEVKDKLYIVVPMTYSRISQEYEDNTCNALSSCGISGRILNEYMNYDQMSSLAMATDIYVNARDTDAFSNSMKEMLYAGTRMIQGGWLTYEELDEIKWPRLFLNNRSELAEKVKYLIEDHPDMLEKKSCAFIWDTFSKKGVLRQWDDLFKLLKIWNE